MTSFARSGGRATPSGSRTKHLWTAGFRLTALYATIFAVSTTLLFGVVYWVASSTLENQLEASVQQKVASLEAVYRDLGFPGVLKEVAERARQNPARAGYYLLDDASGARVVDIMPKRIVMPDPGWTSILFDSIATAPENVDVDPLRIKALCVRLPDGARLLVGQDSRPIQEAREAILQAFGWGGASALLLAGVGGFFVSLGFLRRVESINRAVVSIMDGNLSERVAVKDAHDDLDQLAVNFNAMLDRIQVLMESLRQVSNDIAHDLRSPLSHLRQKLESARASGADMTASRTLIDEAIHDADDILRTFTAMLRIAQIESGHRRAAFADVDLSGLVSFVAESYGPVAEEMGKLLATRVESGIRVQGDKEMLAQLLVNLIENALRHCPEGTRIALSLQRSGDGVLLSLSDNGPGIPPEEREKVFRRFYRTDRSRSTPGTGLGLSLVKAVADLHKAGIELQDNEPGLRVTLSFSRRAGGSNG